MAIWRTRFAVYDRERSVFGEAGSSPSPLLNSMAVSQVKVSATEDSFAFVLGGDLWTATFVGDSAKARRVAKTGSKDAGVEDFYWSPDGKQIAFIETDQTHMPVRGIPDYLAVEIKLVPVKRPFPGEPSDIAG